MFLGLTIEKVFLIGAIGALLLGPERLPELSQLVARTVRSARDLLARTKDRVREEMGPEVTEVDWRRLDPRQYDPRRIIREALLEPDSPFQPSPPPLPPDSPLVADADGTEAGEHAAPTAVARPATPSSPSTSDESPVPTATPPSD